MCYSLTLSHEFLAIEDVENVNSEFSQQKVRGNLKNKVEF